MLINLVFLTLIAGFASFVLVPKGVEGQSLYLAIATFLLGAYFFMRADRFFKNHGSPVSQLIAMMLDFVPEAIVLGALITTNYNEAIFLAVIIAAQNIPEGFNSYREMTGRQSKLSKKKVLFLILLLGLTGPVWGIAGYSFFEEESLFLASMMTFCAGGILYLVFQDIAPQAVLKNHWYPSFGCILGFSVGIIGYSLSV